MAELAANTFIWSHLSSPTLRCAYLIPPFSGSHVLSISLIHSPPCPAELKAPCTLSLWTRLPIPPSLPHRAGLSPVPVETPAALITEVFGKDGLEAPQTSRSGHVAHHTHHHQRWRLHNCHSFYLLSLRNFCSDRGTGFEGNLLSQWGREEESHHLHMAAQETQLFPG